MIRKAMACLATRMTNGKLGIHLDARLVCSKLGWLQLYWSCKAVFAERLRLPCATLSLGGFSESLL